MLPISPTNKFLSRRFNNTPNISNNNYSYFVTYTIIDVSSYKLQQIQRCITRASYRVWRCV